MDSSIATITKEEQTPTMPEDEIIEEITPNGMEGKQQDGRFAFTEIFTYRTTGKYPSTFTKADKLALRKRVERKIHSCGGNAVSHIEPKIILYRTNK